MQKENYAKTQWSPNVEAGTGWGERDEKKQKSDKESSSNRMSLERLLHLPPAEAEKWEKRGTAVNSAGEREQKNIAETLGVSASSRRARNCKQSRKRQKKKRGDAGPRAGMVEPV